MKVKIFILFMAAILIPTLAASQKEKGRTGTVYGYVFNASQSTNANKKIGLAGQGVVLHRYVDGKAAEGARAHTETDTNGRFEFRGLEVGKRFAFYPVSVFAGLEYYGGLVTLTPDSVVKRSDVPVFEATRSDSGVSVTMQHIILTPGRGTLHVKEVLVFANRSRYTYTGHAPTGQPGKNIVLQVDVPDNATEPQFGGDLMACCAVVSDNHIFDTMEFKPGVRQEVVSYVVPYKGNETTVVKKIVHPTAEVDVFIPEDSGTLRAAGFSSMGSFQIRGQTYQRFSTANFDKGDVLTLTLAELPNAPRDWRWLPPVLSVVLVIVGFGVYLWRKESKTTNATTSETTSFSKKVNADRQRIIDEILQLDEAFESGTIDETTYSKVRERLKAQVLEIDGQAVTETASDSKESEEGLTHQSK